MYYFLSENDNDNNNQIGDKHKKMTHQPKKNNFLSQLVYLDFLVKNEIDTTKWLRNIPNHNQLFYLVQSVEQVNISAMNENTYDINETHNIDKDSSILLKFINKDIVQLNTYLKSQTSSKKYIFQLIQFYKYLLTTIDVLLVHNIVHNNIVFNTTVVDFTETPLLSNFSYAVNMNITHFHNHVRNLLHEYSPKIMTHRPTELHILSYMITNKIQTLSMYIIHKIIDDIYDNHFILNHFGANISRNFKEESIKYYKKYVNKSYEEVVSDMMKYFSTWDNYSLSIMYLNILIGIHKTIQKKNKWIILFMRLLLENINPNPNNRNSLEITTNKFNFLVYESDISDFTYLVKHL